MCGRSDVGLGDVRISDSSRRHHHAIALALESMLAQSNACRMGQTRGKVKQ